MKVEVHIHHHSDNRHDNDLLAAIREMLEPAIKFITQKLASMPTKQEFQDALTEVTSALDNIGDDITRLTDQLQGGDLTADEETEVFNSLRAIADKAKALADRTTEPPATPPTEGPGEPA